jgi:hypothetical protein
MRGCLPPHARFGMKLLRSASRRLLVISCCVLSACSTFKTYPGAELPDSQEATVTCSWATYYLVGWTECTFTAVDGLRTSVPRARTTPIGCSRHFGQQVIRSSPKLAPIDRQIYS